MKFIEQQRVHIPANTDFIQRKYLDIQYAPDSESTLLFSPCIYASRSCASYQCA